MSDTHSPAAFPRPDPPVGDAPPPAPVPSPPTPWIVNEDRESWPQAVANGTWADVYPEYPEGPQRTVAPAHSLYDRTVDAGVKAHLEMQRRRTGQDFLVGWDNDLVVAGRRRRPDIFVYRQRPAAYDPADAQSFDVEALGAPDLVIEILSRGTWRNDVGTEDLPDDENKMRYYAAMGIQEYWIVNPPQRSIAGLPLLQGFTLHRERRAYVPIRPDRDGRWYSEVLATHWGVDAEQWVRLWDPVREAWYPIADMIVALHEAEAAAANAQQILDQQQWIRDQQQWILDQQQWIRDQQQWVLDQQQQVRDQVWAAAVRYGDFTPDQRGRYREALAQLDPDQLPDVLDLISLLIECESARARHAAVKLWLDTALDGVPDL